MRPYHTASASVRRVDDEVLQQDLHYLSPFLVWPLYRKSGLGERSADALFGCGGRYVHRGAAVPLGGLLVS